MESSINGKWIIPFMQFGMVRVKTLPMANFFHAFRNILEKSKVNCHSSGWFSNNIYIMNTHFFFNNTFQHIYFQLTLCFECLRRAKTLMQPITKKGLKVSTLNLAYLLIMTRCSCKTRDTTTLKAIFWELCPFLTQIFKQNDGH